jgi:hypothetical protein
MTDSAEPFAAEKFREIKGRRMAYIDEGEGAPIVFADIENAPEEPSIFLLRHALAGKLMRNC